MRTSRPGPARGTGARSDAAEPGPGMPGTGHRTRSTADRQGGSACGRPGTVRRAGAITRCGAPRRRPAAAPCPPPGEGLRTDPGAVRARPSAPGPPNRPRSTNPLAHGPPRGAGPPTRARPAPPDATEHCPVAAPWRPAMPPGAPPGSDQRSEPVAGPRADRQSASACRSRSTREPDRQERGRPRGSRGRLRGAWLAGDRGAYALLRIGPYTHKVIEYGQSVVLTGGVAA